MEHIYELRKNFSIIGLTGTMGSGCSLVGNILSTEKSKVFNSKNPNFSYRNPDKISIVSEKEEVIYENVLFKRKYKLCYKYINQNWKQYKYIDYKKVLLLYCFDYIINVQKKKNITDAISNFIITQFQKANCDGDFDDSNKLISEKDLALIYKSININELVNEVKKLKDKKLSIVEMNSTKSLNALHDIFFNDSSTFNKFSDLLSKLFKKKNYYLRTLFFHRIACNIRGTGNPCTTTDEEDVTYVYYLAKLINRLIKAYKNQEPNKKNCHIVINSLKNSLEIMYFKERYSAFYLMAVHNERKREDVFDKIITDKNDKNETLEKLLQLDSVEYKTGDFKDGVYSSPDIENCIQKSDIHLINRDSGAIKDKPMTFFSLFEQLIKYMSLIQQPGIITPSNIERCMQIAFNSKLNSGCISRQVGAVVTDSGFSVKSVGWNDTPKKTIPCLLRNIEDVINNSNIEKSIDGKIIDTTYSEFELQDSKFKYKLKTLKISKEDIKINESHSGKSFSDNVKGIYPASKISNLTDVGKNCSFCFKTLHNKFEGDDNQVHTRSLHAEENAMLQISKFGGQGLKDGFLFTTASPCELCSKKAYQLGIKKVFYIDKYPGISKEHIIGVGFDAPVLIQFNGVVGRSFNKLFEPFMAYKDEIKLYMNSAK